MATRRPQNTDTLTPRMNDALILLARRGACYKDQLVSWYGRVTLKGLVARGYIEEFKGTQYRLTPSGDTMAATCLALKRLDDPNF